MIITQIQENGKLTFNLNGRLDTSTSNKLHDELIPAFDRSKEIVLNFAELVYVSSAVLRVLLMAQKTAKSKGASVEIRNVSPDVMEVLEMTGFSNILKIV